MIHKTHPLATKLIATALENTQQLHQLLNEESILLKAKSQTQTLNLIVQKKAFYPTISTIGVNCLWFAFKYV
jgi:hypothetical protein